MFKRTKPRIISRSTRRQINEGSKLEDSKAITAELDEELNEKMLVHSGLIIYRKNAEERRKLTSEYSGHNGQIAAIDFQREGDEEENSQMSQRIELPGISDEVESYPCNICPEERVFLTLAGLERHAEAMHPDKLGQLMALAKQIQNEWARRSRRRQEEKFITPEGTFLYDHGTTVLQQNLQNQSNECMRCISIDARDPRMLEYRYPDQSNDQTQLEMDYPHLFCHYCDMVFFDEAQLTEHLHSNHFTNRHYKPKHRRFMCHLCAKLFSGVSALNAHKEREHGIVAMGKNNCQIRELPIRPNTDVLASLQCQLCGLMIVRPSLLIRHMLRVHNRTSDYSAKIVYPLSSPQLPPLGYTIDTNGRLIWECCEQKFDNSEELLAHRYQVHGMPQPEQLGEQNAKQHSQATSTLFDQRYFFGEAQEQQSQDYGDELLMGENDQLGGILHLPSSSLHDDFDEFYRLN